jgi:uncharacterized protein (TIGR03437 family)
VLVIAARFFLRVLATVVVAPALCLGQAPALHSIELLGGSGLDVVQATTADGSGNLYILGKTSSADFPATRVYGARAEVGGYDVFLAKIRVADWALVYSTVIGASEPMSLAVDRAGNPYFTGSTNSSAFPATEGAFRTKLAAGPATFAAKLAAADGTLSYATLLASRTDTAALAVDDAGQAHIAAGQPYPVAAGEVAAPAIASLGGTQGQSYLLKLNADGSRLLSAGLLPNRATASAVALGPDGSIYLAGLVDLYLTEFRATDGAFQTVGGGSSDAFVMKVKPSADAVEFATFLGGAGGDWASFAAVDADGSIFVAGACEYGTSSDPAKPFPLTDGAPFHHFGLFHGFLAKLDPAGGKLLFSTYLSDEDAGYASNPMTWIATAGGFHLAHAEVSHGAFAGLNYYPTADAYGLRIVSFGRDGQLLRAPWFFPGFRSGVITGDDQEVVLAGAAETLASPLPSGLPPIGPLGRDPSRSVLQQNDIALARCIFGGDTAPPLETDRGFVRIVSPSPPGDPEWQLELTSAQGEVPFRLYPPPPQTCCSEAPPFTVSPLEGTTPTRITVRRSGSASQAFPLLIATPGGAASMQLIPMVATDLQVSLAGTVKGSLQAGPTDDSVEADIAVAASAYDNSTFESFPATAAFTVSKAEIPSWLAVTPLSGTAPTTLHIKADVKALSPGGGYFAQIYLLTAGRRSAVSILVSRPGPPSGPAWGLPTGIVIDVPAGGPSPVYRLRFNADDGVAYQVTTSAERLHVAPSSGVGPATFEITVDPAAFTIGNWNESFQVKSDAGVATVTCVIRVAAPKPPALQPYFSYVRGPSVLSPGVRALVGVFNLPLPNETSDDLVPPPQSWNGLSFRYGGVTLPIVALRGNGTFAVQFPYDIATGGPALPLQLVSDDKGVLATGTIYGNATAASPGLVDLGPPVAYRMDGTPVSVDNPVQSGDHIRLSIVGAGKTDPEVPAGELPPDGVVAVPRIPVTAYVGGKPARVVSQALSATRIGVTELEIEVPWLYSGEQMLAIGNSGLYAVPVFVRN